jgi:two-component system chemotaxis response regulator CheY
MAAPNIAELKVLVVDDHMTARAYLEKNLKAMGFSHVDQASSAAQAVDKMAAMTYNIVFLDWNMPGRTGYNFMQNCRQNSAYDKTAFVIVSSESGDRYVIEALKAGATSYIVKPAAENVLQEHIKKVLVWLEQRAAIPDGTAASANS